MVLKKIDHSVLINIPFRDLGQIKNKQYETISKQCTSTLKSPFWGSGG